MEATKFKEQDWGIELYKMVKGSPIQVGAMTYPKGPKPDPIEYMKTWYPDNSFEQMK